MAMVIGLTVSEIDRGKRSEGSGHNEIDYNSLKVQYTIISTIEFECVLNGLPWPRCVLVGCFGCEGRKPTASWRRPPGRPSNVWLNKVQEDASTLPLSILWGSEIARGYGAAQRSTQTTRRRR